MVLLSILVQATPSRAQKDGALVGITIATGMPKHMDVDAKRHPGGNQWLANDLQNEKGGGAICTSPLARAERCPG
jgi:hypothetical protein